jgi:hypothetical protein
VARKRKRPHSEANKFEQWLGSGGLDNHFGEDPIEQMDADNPLPVPQKMIIDTEFMELHNVVMDMINHTTAMQLLFTPIQFQEMLRMSVGAMLILEETYPDFDLNQHNDKIVMLAMYIKLIEIERGKRNGWTHDSE